MTNQEQNRPPVPRQHEFPSHYPSHYHDDEISLVDLARILIKRWQLMAVIFLVVVLGALAYALSLTRTYEYVSIYQVAEEANSPLESPQSLVARANSLYLGALVRELRDEEGLERLPIEASVTNPENTNLLRISSEAAQENVGLVEQLHERMLAKIEGEQRARVERRRESLETRIASTQRALEAAQQSDSASAGDLIASYTERLAELEDMLSQLEEGRVAQTAVQSLDPTGTSRSLIMALALVLGGMLAVMAAFMGQFVAAVRDSFNEDDLDENKA
jgi:uncharacterized protein involved in exopolysaccharide biosynthesis